MKRGRWKTPKLLKPPEIQAPHAAVSTPHERQHYIDRDCPDIPHGLAVALGATFMDALTAAFPGIRVTMAGSVRRGRPISHDIDILVSPPSDAVRAWCRRVGEPLWDGPEKVSCYVGYPGRDKGTAFVQIDFRFVNPESWGAALQYFTGSREHNVKLRTWAKRQGFLLNEYGLFNRETGVRVDDGTEGGIYTALGLRWLPPSYRDPEKLHAEHRAERTAERKTWKDRAATLATEADDGA